MTGPSGRTWSLVLRVLVAALLGCLVLVAPVAAQQGGEGPAGPAPTEAAPSARSPVLGTGDSRSEGEGPGLVGSPVAIAVGVVLVGVLTAAGTLIVLRLTGGRRD